MAIFNSFETNYQRVDASEIPWDNSLCLELIIQEVGSRPGGPLGPLSYPWDIHDSEGLHDGLYHDEKNIKTPAEDTKAWFCIKVLYSKFCFGNFHESSFWRCLECDCIHVFPVIPDTVISYIAIEYGLVEIVSCPYLKMVDLSIVTSEYVSQIW